MKHYDISKVVKRSALKYLKTFGSIAMTFCRSIRESNDFTSRAAVSSACSSRQKLLPKRTPPIYSVLVHEDPPMSLHRAVVIYTHKSSEVPADFKTRHSRVVEGPTRAHKDVVEQPLSGATDVECQTPRCLGCTQTYLCT